MKGRVTIFSRNGTVRSQRSFVPEEEAGGKEEGGGGSKPGSAVTALFRTNHLVAVGTEAGLFFMHAFRMEPVPAPDDCIVPPEARLPVRAIEPDSVNPHVVYVLTAGGGMYVPLLLLVCWTTTTCVLGFRV